ncbi:MAG: hypothetical protein PWP24_750, partial [Clostridiales bacterium]|nr:hypothetical protein [Clostridiales bacterium]
MQIFAVHMQKIAEECRKIERKNQLCYKRDTSHTNDCINL